MNPAFYKTDHITPIVDVRDVAKAHLNALESGKHGHRYLLSHSKNTNGLSSMATILTKKYYEYGYAGLFLKYPRFLIWGLSFFSLPFGHSLFTNHVKYRVDNTKSIEELGIEYIYLRKILEDSANSLIDKGLIQPRVDRKYKK